MADRVLVAMSGGVDSSVSVKLLLDEGYDVAGATMRLYSNEDIGLDKTRTCCSLNDVEDARFVAFKLGIDFHVFNFSDDFKHYVIDNFVDTYLAGGTPNPCIECNKHLKFAKFYERAKLLGFDYIATGHYAAREYDGNSGRWLLKRSPDRSKDQSYVLYSMTQEQLDISRLLFTAAFCDKACIITVRDKADVLRVRLVCIYKFVFFCDITDLVLVHLANRKESVC